MYTLPEVFRPKFLFTFVNVDFKNFLLAFYFVSVAVLAAVLGIESFALSLAVRTHALNLLDHPRSNLLYLDLHAPSFTGCAFFKATLLASIPCNTDLTNEMDLIFWDYYETSHIKSASYWKTRNIYT